MVRRIPFIAILGVLAVLSCRQPKPTPEPPHIQSLVFYLPLEEGSGTTVTDDAASLTGTMTSGVEWVTGRNGCGFGLDFSSTGEVVDFDNNLSLTGGAYTFMAWVYFRSGGVNEFGRIIEKDNGSFSGYTFMVDGGTNLSFYPRGYDGGSLSNTDVTINEWHHIAVSYNAGSLTYYIDAVDDGTVGGYAATLSSFGDMGVGNRVGDTARPVDGILDEIRIYDTAMSQSEIETIMNSTSGCAPAAGGKRGQVIPVN